MLLKREGFGLRFGRWAVDWGSAGENKICLFFRGDDWKFFICIGLANVYRIDNIGLPLGDPPLFENKLVTAWYLKPGELLVIGNRAPNCQRCSLLGLSRAAEREKLCSHGRRGQCGTELSLLSG